MAQLIVRNLEEEVVRELKQRAARHDRSAEEEHREILRNALKTSRTRTPLKALLLEIPNVSRDRDFERSRDRGRPVEL
ncbi:MAG: DNA-binding protein [Thermoanaerobaculia bacterium]